MNVHYRKFNRLESGLTKPNTRTIRLKISKPNSNWKSIKINILHEAIPAETQDRFR